MSRNDRDPFEGGIGGTGIVGVLTDLGSLRINGLRVELEDRTRVRSPYGEAQPGDLRPGMALTIFAQRRRDRLVAETVEIDYAAVGPTQLQTDGQVTVNGIPVLQEPNALGAPAIGNRTAVSGVWSSAGIVATRFDPPPSSVDLISGNVTPSERGSFGIQGRTVRSATVPPPAGGFAVVFGADADGAFAAQRVRSGRFNGVDNLRQLSVEGFLEPSAALPRFRLAGLGHSFDRSVDLASIQDDRGIYFGSYDGLFKAARVYVVPQAFDTRRVALQRGLEDGFDGRIVQLR